MEGMDIDILNSWTGPFNIIKSRLQDKEYYRGQKRTLPNEKGVNSPR